MRRLGKMFRKEWKMIVYCIIFVAHGSFLGHAIVSSNLCHHAIRRISADSVPNAYNLQQTDTYTTFLIVAKGFDNAKASQGSMIMKVSKDHNRDVCMYATHAQYRLTRSSLFFTF